MFECIIGTDFGVNIGVGFGTEFGMDVVWLFGAYFCTIITKRSACNRSTRNQLLLLPLLLSHRVCQVLQAPRLRVRVACAFSHP